MSKQIFIKAIKGNDALLARMYDEAAKYLETIGFIRTDLMSATDMELTFRSMIFSQGKEKVMVEYKKDMFEEVLKLVFSPLEIQFVYDILLMRFNQLAADERDNIFIYNE